MNNEELSYPEITERIKDIIDNRFDGNVRKFSFAMGLSSSAKINRLFLKDKRNDTYPLPSTDIILLISNTFDISTDWLLKGINNINKKNNNTVNIDNKKINGDKNITNSSNIKIKDDSEYLSIINKQQEQINKLLEIIASK